MDTFKKKLYRYCISMFYGNFIQNIPFHQIQQSHRLLLMYHASLNYFIYLRLSGWDKLTSNWMVSILSLIFVHESKVLTPKARHFFKKRAFSSR